MICGTLRSQTRSTKEAKILLIVNESNTKIKGLELFEPENVQNIDTRHPRSKFFIGLFKGSYELEERRVVPKEGAVLTIYTERQFFPNDELFLSENFVAEDQLNLGDTETKIISNSKGELVLRIL